VRVAIEERSIGATQVELALASVHFTVELGASGTSQLWVDLPEGSFRREFQAPTCAEAVATVAVIAAMVLDAAPAARREMADVSASASPPEPVPPPPEEKPKEPPAEPKQAPAPKLAAEPRRQTRPPRAAAPASKLRWTLTLGGALETAVAPTPPVGVMGGIEAFSERSGWWTPDLRASLLVTTTATEHVTGGDGKFRLIAGHLGTCPWRVPLGPSLRLLPCAAVEAGSLRAEGGGAAQNLRSTTMPWLAAAVAARALLRLAGPVALEAGVEGKLLVRHDTFVFRPESLLVYRVPLVSLNVGLALVLTL
jgi:hypothetical protein